MNQINTNWKPRHLVRSHPSHPISSEEKAKLDAEKYLRYQKARAFFEKNRYNLMQQYYNWYITIEPETEEYFLSQNDLEILKKLENKPHLIGKVISFCLNETGFCGSI